MLNTTFRLSQCYVLQIMLCRNASQMTTSNFYSGNNKNHALNNNKSRHAMSTHNILRITVSTLKC